MNRKSLLVLIIPLIALVGFLFFPKIGLANDFENITPEEAGKYLELPGENAEKILDSLHQVMTDKGIDLITSVVATDQQIAVVAILDKISKIHILNHFLVDAPIEIIGKIIKTAVDMARLFGAKDISVVMDKFEKETVNMAIDYAMKKLFQDEIKVTPGAIQFKYKSYQGEQKEVVLQYIIIYQPLGDKKGKVEIRFYSPNPIEPPNIKGIVGIMRGIFFDLNHDLPPFIAEISGTVEKTDLRAYRWIEGPTIKITFSDSVPDFGIKPLTFWEKHLLKPIETAIKNIEVIITKVTGKSLGIVDIWEKIKSTFSRFNPFSPAAVVGTQLPEGEELEEEDLEVEEPLAEVGQEVGEEVSEEPEIEPELSLEETQEILDSISEKIKESNEEAEEKEEETVEEEIEEPEEEEEETEPEETPITICEKIPGNSPVRNKIIINEVAWMGGSTSANDEWIELKNLFSSQINLAGWQLLDKEKQIKVVFEEEVIPAGGFYLLERTDDDSVSNIAADFIYTGGLGNTEEALYLFNENCQLQDEVIANPDWPAGDSSSKRTMERKSNLDWQTSQNIGGTPKRENSGGYYVYQGGGGYSPPPPPPPEQVCDSENIDLCITQELCEGASLYWYNETCNLDAEPEPEEILITEIQIGAEGDEKEEFVELYNPNETDVTLTGWYMQRKTETGSDYLSFAPSALFSGKTIQAKNYFLIARQDSSFTSLADIIIDNPLTANNSLVLKNQNKIIIDEFNWPEVPAGQSYGRKWDETSQTYLDDFELQIPTPKAKNQPLPPEEPPSEATYQLAIDYRVEDDDPGNSWQDEPLAFDGDTETFAESKVSHNSWTAWLELLPPAEKSLGIRFWIDIGSPRSFFQVEVLYSDYESWDCLKNWNFPYSPAPKGKWVILDYPEGEKSVEKARVKFHSAGYSHFYPVYLSEFQFKTYE